MASDLGDPHRVAHRGAEEIDLGTSPRPSQNREAPCLPASLPWKIHWFIMFRRVTISQTCQSLPQKPSKPRADDTLCCHLLQRHPPQKSWQATLVIDSWGKANEFAVWTNLFNFLGICRQRYQWTPGQWAREKAFKILKDCK